jgi:hypothetical protein
MPTRFINNKGVIQTRFQHNNSPEQVNEMKWNANYDGKKAIVKLDTINKGKKRNYRINLNNKELSKLLSIPPVNIPLEDRLTNDFLQPPTTISSKIGALDPFSNIHLDKEKLSNYDIKPVLKMIPKEQPYSENAVFTLTPSHQEMITPSHLSIPVAKGKKTRKARKAKKTRKARRTRSKRTRNRSKKVQQLGLGLGFPLGLSRNS